MDDAASLPTDARAVIEAFEYGTSEILDRLRGLTDAEYRWEPVDGCWTVRPVANASGDPSAPRFVADFVPEAEPPPFTTIAWRLWHIGQDCLESYSRRAFGVTASDLPESDFVGTADEAISLVKATAENFLNGLRSRGGGVADPLGPSFGPFAERTYVDLGLHAYREVVHHGAEIGLLRDLYRLQPNR